VKEAPAEVTMVYIIVIEGLLKTRERKMQENRLRKNRNTPVDIYGNV